MSNQGLNLRLATALDAQMMSEIIVSAFDARPQVDPPAQALSETPETIAERLLTQHAIIAFLDDKPVGCLFISQQDKQLVMLHRVSVIPQARRTGVAGELVRAAATLAADEGNQWMQLEARAEFPKLISWWQSYGFQIQSQTEYGYILARHLPARYQVGNEQEMRNLGKALAKKLHAGDLIIANGELGAGKTTLTQGIGEGLEVNSPVISPTFVLSRRHQGTQLNLMHVDAYRLSSAAELDDLDLEQAMQDSVTLIEWGAGLAEQLSDERLEIEISRQPASQIRTVYITGFGKRWLNEELGDLL